MNTVIKLILIFLFSNNAIGDPLRIATSTNLKLLNTNYQYLLEAAINNAGFQVEFIEFKNADTLQKSNKGQLDGELYRYSYTMRDHKNLLMIPVKLNSSALFVYVPQKSTCPSPQQLTEHTPIGVLGVTYFKQLYGLSKVGFIEEDTITRTIETLLKKPMSFTVFPHDIAPSLMQLTGTKLKRCYSKPLLVLTSYSYLHKKHHEKIGAITQELKTLLLDD
ncbi:hypothetical protein CW745_10985 [Psychromonas sp. psych-6C06]|uniref:hypothetical protein n=1 Tax=Psychromonas sp. psych-6C06 TaxID=2058089 RepID=UPI000C346737|nr:hypothetical protein [Psychromonas sp. psych-6C06]PKF61828.1 hypothetical protein CW745_10985 [Psychromonas sp. psych-6C06]